MFAQANENLSRYLKEMKVWLYGEPGEQSAKEETIPVSQRAPGASVPCSAAYSSWSRSSAGSRDRSVQEQAPNVLLHDAEQYRVRGEPVTTLHVCSSGSYDPNQPHHPRNAPLPCPHPG